MGGMGGMMYGPFYYHGKENLRPQTAPLGGEEKDERQSFFGFEKAKNRREAIGLYALDTSRGSLEWVHTLYIKVPTNCHDAMIFVGPVADGIGVQGNYNKSSAECVVVSVTERLS